MKEMFDCKLCHSLTNKAGLARLAIDFEPWELQQSEELSGCRACATILAGIRRLQNPNWHFEDDVRRVYLYGLSKKHDTLSAEIYYNDDRPKLVLEFYHLNDDSDAQSPWEAIGARKHINGNPLGRDALSWVKFNLDICEHGHELCSSNINRPLPFRTLHLKQSAGDTVEVILVEGEPGVATGRYATLSHRWGNHQTCITTLNNVQNRKCGIPWHTIPKTFQDAMIYCLELGIDYIWIDALCIIQDSPKDWQQQSAQMAGIYQNSYITLSATTSMDDSAGCFGMSSSASVQSKKSLLGQNPPIYIREKLRHWTDPGGGCLPSEGRFPLLTRAWVFQERILSMRTLHFCDQELVWECAENTICECDGVSVNASIKQQFATSLRYAGDLKARLPDKAEEFNKVEELDEAEELDQAKLKNSLDLFTREQDLPLQGSVDHELQLQKLSVRSRVWDRAKTAIPFLRVLRRQRSSDAKAEPTDETLEPTDEISEPTDNISEPTDNISEPTDRIAESPDRTFIQGEASQQTNGRDLELWHKMVEQYSNLELTRISDRLPALSGLAERIASGSRPYLAGLWKDTLHLDLLWRVDQIKEAHGRSPENLSPTWSWSSVSSGVRYWTREDLKENTRTLLDTRYLWPQYGPFSIDNDETTQQLQTNRAELDQLPPKSLDWRLSGRPYPSIRFVRYEMVQIGENPFGEVEKGVLQIRGYVRRATLKYVKVASDERYHDSHIDPLQYRLDLKVVQTHFYADYNLSESHPEHQVLDNEAVHLLEVLVNLSLVLRRTETGDYQRIGIFRGSAALDEIYGLDLMMEGTMEDVRLI